MLTTVAAGRVFDYSYCIGMYSMSGLGFWAPQDFALGKDGRIYVLSRGVEELGQRVSKVTFDHKFQGQFGSVGAEDGRFMWPRSIDIDGHDRVYVSDEFLNRISIFDAEGAFRYHWGQTGSEAGELNGPSGLAFDTDDNVWVVDSLNHRVQRFSQIGQFQTAFGQQGSGDGDLEMPWGICTDREDNVYVADWGNNRVQKFSPAGALLVKFEASSTGVGALKGPSGVAVDSDGDVYVTDWGNHRLQIYAADGQFITTLVGDAQEPSPWTQNYINANPDILKARRRADMEPEWRFRRPVAVNVDENDRIIVLESMRHRMQIYDKLKDYEEHPLNL
jgi:DNA-binding beta-propeller fold protein YncE